MSQPISHYFLTRSQSASSARNHVIHYLKGHQLICYAEFVILEEEIIQATDKRFSMLIQQAIATNRQFMLRMLEHLKEEGVSTLDALLDLQQGYETKVLHTLTHMLDGFIGVDSYFYNLIEDSHWLSKDLEHTIHNLPQEHWLVPVHTGKLTSSLLHL